MSGSRNARKRRSWPPSAKAAEKLLRRFRAQMDASGPREVSLAARRLEVSMVGDKVPDPEDLATVMIWLLGAQKPSQCVQEPKKKPKQKKASSKRRWDKSSPAQKRTRRSVAPRPAPTQTGFSQQMEAQEDPAAADVRSRLRAPKSRVRSDGSGRRVIVLGDGQD